MPDKGLNKKLLTAIVLAIAVGLCVFVFWPEKEVQKDPFAVSKSAYASVSDTTVAAQGSIAEPDSKDGAATSNQTSSIDTPSFRLQNPDEMAAEERDLLRRVEQAVDSVILYKDLRAQTSPRAERLIQDALKKYGESPFFHAVYADLLFVQRKFEKAVIQYQLAYGRMGNIPDFRANYAKAAHACAVLRTGRGDYVEAMHLFETVAELQPDYPQIDTSLFMCYSQDAYMHLEAENASSALRSIQKGLAIDSNRFAMNFYAGVAYSHPEVNQPRKAIRYLEKCKKLNPDHIDTRSLLHELYTSIDEPEKARRVLFK